MVRKQMLAALLAGIAAVTAQEACAEQLGAKTSVVSGPKVDRAGMMKSATARFSDLQGGRAQVASATRRLDLSKLTMADFGDVEPGR
ncbi:MAG: hypothetical protein QM780_03065 [Hyphomicrobium sp.]|uniref:hypothetical protein n=1 Tax=Hyphomicrobium sp. TaxID=82 RepID=UPI0039E707B7